MFTKGYEMKLNVRPVYVGLQHKYFFEGPCRMDKTENLYPEADAMINAGLSQAIFAQTKAELGDIEWINLMDPIYAERDCDFLSKEALFDAFMEDYEKVDVFLVGCHIARGDIVVELAQRTGKPIMIKPGTPSSSTRYVSALRARGYEAFCDINWDIARTRLSAMRLRKVVANTHILQVVRFDSTSEITNNSFYCPNDVTKKLGVKFRGISVHELIDQTIPGDPMQNHCTPGRMGQNPTEEDMEKIRQLSDELCAGAEFVDMEKDKVEKSVRFWYTVQKMLDLYDCNAFCMCCPDFCSTRRAHEEQITPCLCHSLNNELGIPSSCEYDPIATLSMQLLETVSGNASHMGEVNNLEIPFTMVKEAAEELMSDIDDDSNLITLMHSVGSRKMHGIKGEPDKYGLTPFAYTGWGATLRHDYKLDKGQVITQCRFSPDCKKLFIAKGTIEGGASYHAKNCSLTAAFRVADARDYYYKQLDFGAHVPMVFGDYTEELKMFAELVGLEPVMA